MQADERADRPADAEPVGADLVLGISALTQPQRELGRDRELDQLRMDLEVARLTPRTGTPSCGPCTSVSAGAASSASAMNGRSA